MPERGEAVQINTKPAAVVAFVAVSMQTGRTNMVANQAWILASAGHRVLVLDMGTGLMIHDYLRRFGHEPALPAAEVIGEQLAELLATAVDARGGPAKLMLRRYLLPEPAVPVNTVSLDGSDSSQPLQAVRSATLDDEDAGRLRQGLHDCPYDYVLVSLPTTPGEEAEAAKLASQICDVLVVGLTPQQEAIWAAKALVDHVREAAAGLRIVLASSPFGGSNDLELRRDRNLVLRAFEDLLTGDDPVEHVEVPHQPGHAARHTIAALVEEPGPNEVAHERLTSVITVGAVTGQGPVTERIRARYRLGLGMGEPGREETLWLGYAPRDRAWADWIAAQLRIPGIVIRRLTSDTVPPPGATVILVLSPALPGWFTDPASLRRLRSGGFDLVTVRIPGYRPPNEFTDLGRPADLTSVGAEASAGVLRAALWLFTVDFLPSEVRYPHSPASGDIPPVNPRFVGREDQLEALRETLCPLEDGRAGHDLRLVSLHGPSGVGKSEIAREYVHRFGGMYEFVWWISATDEQTVRSRLVDLGAEMLRMDNSEAPLVLKELSGRKHGHWLLVYDNAPGDIDKLTPRAGNGDVIVTTLSPLTAGSRLTIRGLDPWDSRELLGAPATGLQGISEQHATAIGDPLGHMPIALQLAASWLRETARTQRKALMPQESAITYAAEELARVLGELGPVPSVPDELVRRMLNLTATVIEGSRPGAMAIALAQLCSFLDPDGIALNLLRAKPMLAELAAAAPGDAGESLIRDEIEIERVLWTGVRFGLFAVDQGHLGPNRAGKQPESGKLRLHRTVQQALRTELARAGTLHTRRAQVLRGLAGFAPTGVETHPERRADFVELQRHLDELDLPALDFAAMAGVLGEAGKPGSDGWHVRMWIVAQIRFLVLERGTEVFKSTASLASRLNQAWTAAFGEADHLRCSMAAQLANLLRDLGQAEAAMRLNEQVLQFQRRDLGLQHPRTLTTARSFAGDYRERGDYDAALAENEAALLGFTDVFGADHPQTLMTAFNLAHARFLAGLVNEALDLLESSHRDQLRVFSEDNWLVWLSGRLLATYSGELGRYDTAFDYLDSTIARIQRYAAQPDHHEEMLQARRTRVVLERRADRPGRDRQRRLTTLLRQFDKQFGSTSLRTLECTLSLASELHFRGESGAAAKLGAECVAGISAEFGEHHPVTGACRVNHLLFLRDSGQLEQVLADGPGVLSDLTDRLDAGHPWVIAAAVNHSVALAKAHRLEEALAHIEPAYHDALNSIHAEHPTTVAAAGNLDRIRRLASHSAASSPSEADEHAWQQVDIHLP
jgi:tetratricopeptide (TPR) repeat protein/Mrp family chromosome partitioning ATPase